MMTSIVRQHARSFLILGVLAIALVAFSTMQLRSAYADPYLDPPTVFLVPGDTLPSEECEYLGYDSQFKKDVENGGSWAGSGNFLLSDFAALDITADYNIGDGILYSWSSAVGIDAVVIKGGVEAYAYTYDPEATFGGSAPDADGPGVMTAPLIDGTQKGISHISFCYDRDVEVKKTVKTDWTETNTWDIAKGVSLSEGNYSDSVNIQMWAGQSAIAYYEVDVDHTKTDTYSVSGVITVSNPWDVDLKVDLVTDVGDGLSDVVVSGTIPVTLSQGDEVEFTYTAVSDGSNGTNTATATQDDGIKKSGSKPITFSADPDKVIGDRSVTLTDDEHNTELGGPIGLSTSGVFTYPVTYDCSTVVLVDTASISGLNTNLDDSASVDVDCYDLTVTKGGSGSYNRTYDWTIDKSGPTDEIELWNGTATNVEFDIVLDRTITDSDIIAGGSITIDNPSPWAVEVGLNDPYPGAALAAVSNVVDNGGGSFTVDAASLGTISWGVKPDDINDVIEVNDGADSLQSDNSVTVSYIGGVQGDGNGAIDDTAWADSHDWDWSEAIIGPTEVSIDDDLHSNGDSGVLTGDTSYSYSGEVSCDPDTHTNVATVLDGSGNTVTSDRHTVNIECYEPAVSKTVTADGTYDRDYDWTIAKTAYKYIEEAGGWNEFGDGIGDTVNLAAEGPGATVQYQLDISNTWSDALSDVSGTIEVSNGSGTLEANVVVSDPDVDSISLAASSDAGTTYNSTTGEATIPAGQTLVLDWTVDGSTASNGDGNYSGSNTALVTLTDNSTHYGTNEVNWDYGTGAAFTADGLAVLHDNLVDIATSQVTASGDPISAGITSLNGGDASTTLWYQSLFTRESTNCDTVVNVASLTNGVNVIDGAIDDAIVDVKCLEGDGNYTKGYWKTHATDGPAEKHRDDTWDLVPGGDVMTDEGTFDAPSGSAEATPFFSSGDSWHDAAYYTGSGNAYNQAASQYVAAVLNSLSNGSIDPVLTNEQWCELPSGDELWGEFELIPCQYAPSGTLVDAEFDGGVLWVATQWFGDVGSNTFVDPETGEVYTIEDIEGMKGKGAAKLKRAFKDLTRIAQILDASNNGAYADGYGGRVGADG
ncbi:hypothetical protein GKO46_12955 [SAR202 cluster bacterium JH702]|uniref:Ig-like domain-containing protein n=1 Tax=Candidatus Lucifugimonas marina TaxID=3038979 RepID=A0ABD4XTM2_9CHLR|nr:hypothetical protein [SAR202 cluster bacterium JH702]